MFGLFKNNINLSQLPQQAQQFSMPQQNMAPAMKQPQAFGMFNSVGSTGGNQPPASAWNPLERTPSVGSGNARVQGWFDPPEQDQQRFNPNAHDGPPAQNSFTQYVGRPNGTVRQSIPRARFPVMGAGNGAF